MAGHSKWSKVKHIKGSRDVRRGAASGKPVKEITVATRIGVGDLRGSPRGRLFVKTVRDRNMPKENTERADQKETDTQHVHSDFDIFEETLARFDA